MWQSHNSPERNIHHRCMLHTQRAERQNISSPASWNACKAICDCVIFGRRRRVVCLHTQRAMDDSSFSPSRVLDSLERCTGNSIEKKSAGARLLRGRRKRILGRKSMNRRAAMIGLPYRIDKAAVHVSDGMGFDNSWARSSNSLGAVYLGCCSGFRNKSATGHDQFTM